ncbi:MAG TPA: glycoside hydrolase family 43 protein [Candidatus Bathyarchaeia archaeon]|nr:glycoside hydrolase family 43 protein [Candidatus Bathyarchaeia archaeon]
MKLLLLTTLLVASCAQGKDCPLTLDQFRVRDPFILPVPSQGLYYLFNTGVAKYAWGRGFPVYTSRDLVNWAGPEPAFKPPDDFPTINLWAPEVHPYNAKYYMFATLKLEGKPRGTHILVANRPAGPYTMRSRQPITPPGWYCLDGTFHLDDNAKPWMVFCHEWVQTGDGEICAVPLNDDLSAPTGEPVLLLRASAVPWVTPQDIQHAVTNAIQKGPETKPGEVRESLVTDGPFIHRTSSGALLMLWSTFGNGSYNVVVARSQSGTITGPWAQDAQPLFTDDGGHAMVFRRFDGQLMIALHQPNVGPRERTRLFEVEEREDRLTLGATAPEPAPSSS